MTIDNPAEHTESMTGREALEGAATDLREMRALIGDAIESVLGSNPIPAVAYPPLESLNDIELAFEVSIQIRDLRNLVAHHAPIVVEKMQSPMARMAIRTFSGLMGN